MLVDLYVEALLSDPDQADRVWELWNAGVITDDLAPWAWLLVAIAEYGKYELTGIKPSRYK